MSAAAAPGSAADVVPHSASGGAWVLYLLECANGALYAGITNDLEARFKVHQAGKGARFTRANPPVRIVATRAFPDRSMASKAEWAVKQLPRHRKVSYFLAGDDDLEAAEVAESVRRSQVQGA